MMGERFAFPSMNSEDAKDAIQQFLGEIAKYLDLITKELWVTSMG